MVEKIIDQVLSDQTEERRLLERKVEDKTLELHQVIHEGNTIQTDIYSF